MVIVGAGNLGQALANYTDFEKRGFVISGIFDVNPRLIGMTIRGIEVRSMDDLEEFVKEKNVDIAALTLPKTKAPAVAADLVNWGVKAIWNFAPTDLNLPADVVVENVHLAESLMRVSYNLKNSEHLEEE